MSQEPITKKVLSKTKKAAIGSAIVITGLFALGNSNKPADDVTLAADTKTATSQTQTKSKEERKKAPAITTTQTTETQAVAFQETTVQDASMYEGTTAVRTAGADGIKTFTYETVTTDGVAGEKRLVKEEITTQPISKVTAVGTKVRSSCDPNYSGCVPIASDVDCAGGSGNGPAYVRGPVAVIGSDIYDLDRNGDGYGCE